MRTFIPPRLRKPLTLGLAGTVFAAAWLIRGGPGWSLAIAIEVTVLASAIAAYIQGGRDTEDGALAASRRDERQQLVNMRSRALAGNAAMLAAFVGVTVGVAINATWWWPCAVILAVTGFAYLFGLSQFGVGEEGPAEGEDEEYQAPSAAHH
jgi:hypothetical protein